MRWTLSLDYNQVRVYDLQLVVEVSDICLHLCVYGGSLSSCVSGRIVNVFLMCQGLELLQMPPVDALVEEILVKGNDLVDMGVFLL